MPITNDGFYLTAVLTMSLLIPMTCGGLMASLKKKPAIVQSAAFQGLTLLIAFLAVRCAKRASTEESYAALLGGILTPLEVFQASS